MTDLLPKCLLTDLIKKRRRENGGNDFDYLGQLRNCIVRVKQDIPNIFILFPEFTPHDDIHHIDPLFILASEFLGERLLSNLNITELFLLASALYCHDWGMSVSDLDKQRILTAMVVPRTDSYIHNDQRDFSLVLKAHGSREVTPELPITDADSDLWREFVRTTHARRSADRIKHHFTTIDSGTALRLAQVCESHGEDCETLRNERLYPIRCSVLGQVVNIRAIAIYLRLVDLFDLADNRTPYALWKHVAPINTRSVTEWEKHRSIRQVTFPSYSGGFRHILVDGVTDNHEIYSQIKDLEAYCRREFRFCTELLAEMPSSKYSLDVVDIDWKIIANGFNPLSVRFEFDRERILGYLSHELYQGEKLVFLRELLQNSIDAIRMRRELLKGVDKASQMGYLGYIEVKVDKFSDGSLSILWKDNGIGMDEHILRNHLAVVGSSYYGSHDFKQLKLTLDPISEFGIGLLTCFTVSDSMVIETKRDQNIFNDSKALRIAIPKVDRYFRVEELDLSALSPGTTIKLSIKREVVDLFKKNNDSHKPITEYLHKIAGFVEFPIVVYEGTYKAIIAHPNAIPEQVHSQFGSDNEILQLRLDYKFEDMFFPEDVHVAKQVLAMEKWDLNKDLGLNDYEGMLSYPVPIDDNTDFTGGGYPAYEEALRVLSNSNPDLIGKIIRKTPGCVGRIHTVDLKPRDGSYIKVHNVYRDGILIPEAITDHFTHPKYASLIVNIPKTKAMISLARNSIISDSHEWLAPISEAHAKTLSLKYHNKFSDENGPSIFLLFRLASFGLFHGLSNKQLDRIFSQMCWPLPLLHADGNITFKRYGDLLKQPIYCMPDPLSRVSRDSIQSLVGHNSISPVLTYWSGADTLIDNYATWGGSNSDSIIVNHMKFMIRMCLETSHRFDSVIFLTPPWNDSPPLLQEIWLPKPESDFLSGDQIRTSLRRLAENPAGAVELQQPQVQNEFTSITGIRISARLTRFPPPFENYFAYGNEALNVCHPMAQALLHLALVSFSEYNQQIDPIELTAIKFILRQVFQLPAALSNSYSTWARNTDDLWSISRRAGLTSCLEVETLSPTIDKFVPGTTDSFLDIKVRENWKAPFGELGPVNTKSHFMI